MYTVTKEEALDILHEAFSAVDLAVAIEETHPQWSPEAEDFDKDDAEELMKWMAEKLVRVLQNVVDSSGA